MLAHSPKTTNLAAYATASTSTQQEQQQVVSIITSPDDSDFLDSDAEGETFDEDQHQQYQHGGRSTPRGLSSSSSFQASPTPEPGRVETEIPLIYISNRLYYTYFTDESPSPDFLNQGDGSTAAIFEHQQQQNPQRPGAAQQEDLPSAFHWFNVDEDLVYLSFYQDWGPLNVALFYRFCMHVLQLLNDEDLADKALVFYSCSEPSKKANTSLLAMMYSMIVDRIEPADAFHPFNQLEFRPFRDAGYGRADYYLTMQDILYGVHRAIKEGLLDLAEFNLAEYEHYEQVQNGDWNWLTPSFLAFASPNDREYVAAIKANGGQPPKSGSRLGRKLPQVFTNTIKYFKARNIKLVVRLNNPLYDKAAFEDAGIAHLDLYFDDGSNPSEEILREFIRRAHQVIESGGAIAVHCKAGLGRTGVLIGAYLIWRFGFSASEVIGFMRIMRPGCVVGPQQHFMYQNFAHWIRWSVQDQAIAIARKTIEAERAAMMASGAVLVDRKNSLKRPSTPEYNDENSEPPVTPRARKMPHVIPATAAPAVKPVPCVGQPRKSPSPSRKLFAEPPSSRLGGAAPTPMPAMASLPSNSSSSMATTSSTASIIAGDLPRSASEESLASLESRNALKNPGTPSSVASLRNSWEKLAGSTTPKSSARSDDKISTPSSGRVLTEAQRWNNVTPSDPNATPTTHRSLQKDGKVPVVHELDPQTLTARRGGRHHERAQSEYAARGPVEQEEDVFGPTITSPPHGAQSAAKRVPSFAASPHVRAAYGLKDSKSPNSPRSPRASPNPQGGNNENLEQQPPSLNGKKVERPTISSQTSDAEVLGVLGINGQENKAAKPSLRTFGRAPSSNSSISPAKIRPLPTTSSQTGTGSSAAAGAANHNNAAVSRHRPVVPAASAGSGSNRNAGGAVRSTSGSGSGRPVASNSRTVSGSSQSSSSGSRPVSQASNGTRPGSQASNGTTSATTGHTGPSATRQRTESRANARLASSRGANEGMTSKPATSGQELSVPSSNGNIARRPINRSGSGTVPISNSANAAMLAARSNLKRPRPSPDVPQSDTFSTTTTTTTTTSKPPPVSGTSVVGRFARNVRRRRSSLSSADIGMA
ncbi:unnamed protein product [Sympodiomycopsis kandeliae]